MSYDFECLLCRDEGRYGGCPKCGKEKNLMSLTKVKKATCSDGRDLKIPNHYIKNRWDESILYKDRSEYYDDESFENYIKQLTGCYNIIKEGNNIELSALVSAPIGFGKTTWAYSCILAAMEHGLKVVPMIDTSQLRRLLTLYSERPSKENTCNGFSVEDYLESDLLILTVTKGPEYVFAYETIYQVLDMRSRNSKPTLIISDRSLRELIKFDKNNILYSLVHGGTNADNYKYAILIEFNNYLKSQPGSEKDENSKETL